MCQHYKEVGFNLCTLWAHFQYGIGELDTLLSIINSWYYYYYSIQYYYISMFVAIAGHAYNNNIR